MKLITSAVIAMFAVAALANQPAATTTKEESKTATTATAPAKKEMMHEKKECKKGDTKCEAEMKKAAKH